MKVQEFLSHHGIQSGNPFAEEDAQTDTVFKEHCVRTTFHPAWDKIAGTPGEPSTSVVFGEKGAGKTALRLQLTKNIDDFNAKNPERRVLTVDYVEFNQSLDLLASAWAGDEGKALASWRIWDHIDSILSNAVGGVVDGILKKDGEGASIRDQDARSLSRAQKRDLLLMTAIYDSRTAEPFRSRWNRLRRRLRFGVASTYLWNLLAVVVGVGALAGAAYIQFGTEDGEKWLFKPWPYVVGFAGCVPFLLKGLKNWWLASVVRREVRVVTRRPADMRFVFSRFKSAELEDQPLPRRRQTDARYELLSKFLELLEKLQYRGMMVLMDRVDEPSRINGAPEKMRLFVWPMLDSKLLRYPGIGFKMLLPIQLASFLPREDRAFHDRARLDKLNLVRSLDWTGQALFDLANDRLAACGEQGETGRRLRSLFDSSLTTTDIVQSFDKLRVPRHLFKFLYRVIAEHCQAHSSDDPQWEISAPIFHASLAVYLRDMKSIEDGIAVG